MKSQSCMGCWDHKLLSLCVANNFGLYFILLSCIIFLCLRILIYKYGDWPYCAAHPVEKAKRGHMRRHFHCSEPWWIQLESTVQAGGAGLTTSNRARVTSMNRWEQQELHNLIQATHETSKGSGKCAPLFSKENRFLKGYSTGQNNPDGPWRFHPHFSHKSVAGKPETQFQSGLRLSLLASQREWAKRSSHVTWKLLTWTQNETCRIKLPLNLGFLHKENEFVKDNSEQRTLSS